MVWGKITYIKSGGMLNTNHVNAALYSLVGSTVNWMRYNIELACTSNAQEEKDTAIKEVNLAMTTIMRFKILMPDLLKVLIEK